jgi:hypothetical protein
VPHDWVWHQFVVFAFKLLLKFAVLDVRLFRLRFGTHHDMTSCDLVIYRRGYCPKLRDAPSEAEVFISPLRRGRHFGQSGFLRHALIVEVEGFLKPVAFSRVHIARWSSLGVPRSEASSSIDHADPSFPAPNRTGRALGET